MPVAGGSFKQCYNTQALVDTETMLVVIAQVTQATNDKQQIVPMLERLAARSDDLPAPTQLTADTGFFRDRLEINQIKTIVYEEFRVTSQ